MTTPSPVKIVSFLLRNFNIEVKRTAPSPQRTHTHELCAADTWEERSSPWETATPRIKIGAEHALPGLRMSKCTTALKLTAPNAFNLKLLFLQTSLRSLSVWTQWASQFRRVHTPPLQFPRSQSIGPLRCSRSSNDILHAVPGTPAWCGTVAVIMLLLFLINPSGTLFRRFPCLSAVIHI